MSERLYRGLFLAGVVILALGLVFTAGMAVARLKWWPYPQLESAWSVARSYWIYGEVVPPRSLVRAPARAARERFTLHRPDRMGDGQYVFVGWDSAARSYAAWLLDVRGQVQHRWPIDIGQAGAENLARVAHMPHGLVVLKDGSLVLNFDSGKVLQRLDACGDVVWRRTGLFHHSLRQTDDGSFWTWRSEGKIDGHLHYLHNFDADTGEIIREISLSEDVIKPMGARSAIFGVRPGFRFRRLTRDLRNPFEGDIFHPNDIDVLSASLAPAFPGFAPGDLLISLRNLHLLAVLDPDSGKIKWWGRGPWMFQHDPDFRADGTISVYSNNSFRGRSEILWIDPGTGAFGNDLFRGEARFYSEWMGTHQTLPNGNVLIVVPGEGRVLEVTATGELVMEFNNLYTHDAAFNAHVENGTWLPGDYFESQPVCDGTDA